ncbi:hypothetical protein [Nocardia asteroides]|uniref:hypothetical protein n=1 Tax=Nocardia asteroides TaxID=1824 RepID=UPI0033D16C38
MTAERSRARRWQAPMAVGTLLCLGCCLAPILIAAGVLGGGTFLVSLAWLEPLGFALIGLGVAGLIWSRIYAPRGECVNIGDAATASCANSGCRCATAAE